MDIRVKKHNYPPRKLTQEKLDKILFDVREGAPYKYAAESNFISERHFYYMMLQGIVDIENDKMQTIYAQLVQGLRDIEMAEIKECRKNIKSKAKGHRGAEWTLEHVYWKTYGTDAKLMELAKEIEMEKGKSDEGKSKEASEENANEKG